MRNAALVIIAATFSCISLAQDAEIQGARAVPVSLTTVAPALTTVVVTGSSAYAPPRLFATYRDQLGAPISRELAGAITRSLTELYTGDGFVKPEIRLDDKLTGRGVLGVQVFEAKITGVVIEGEPGAHRAAMESIAGRLLERAPLRRDDIPAALREMRAIAGLAIEASTRRDERLLNGFELVLKADYSPVDGMVRMNNRGTEQVGPYFVLGQLFANGLLGGREKLGLIFASSTDPGEYLGGGLYLDAPLGDAGTRVNALLFRSDSAPNEAPVNFDDEYSRQRATLKFSRPLQRGAAIGLTLTGGFEADDLAIDRDGAIVREDRLRILEAGARANWRGAGALQYSGSLLLRQGLDSLGGGLQATDLASDPRRADFLVAQLQATVYRRIGTQWSARFDGFAQNSGYVLPDSERFKIGGDRLGRGFEVAEIAGDSGIGGKLELRRDLRNTDSFVGRLSTYGFYDIGSTWKQDLPGSESASTAGLGFAMQGASLTGYLELATPLTGADIEGKRRASVFAEISYRF